MLFKLIKNIFAPQASSVQKQDDALTCLNNAKTFQQQGDWRSAIAEYRQYLEVFPHDAPVMNDLGCCLADAGDAEEASKLFEMAFSLDDSYLPVVVNHAKHLLDRQLSQEGMVFLRQAKIHDPDSAYVDAVYAGIALATGNAKIARDYNLRAWLKSFDHLRFANCYLFQSSYDDIDEARLAAEHRFWGETLTPLGNGQDGLVCPNPGTGEANQEKTHGKVRIGYWSPDFRNHSVRYFFRPLLDNHDRNKFEIFIYHDFPRSDIQTKHIESKADRFFQVADLSDQKFLALIRSHQLDVLVELAGHSSSNRLNLLSQRLATLQLSGLGYPPTTGLSSIDGKLLDVHIDDIDSARFYTEKPLVLPGSFWCFDPKEEAHINPEPPVVRNGYITFACVGNIAKITSRILDCWAQILSAAPTSKLLLRSISFNDSAAEDFMRQQIESAGIPLDRVDMLKPAAGQAYFESYNDIDIVLDTSPFNGGTTTCFATYMGVPVVTWAGQSLLSRMGQSILNNLDLADWVVSDANGYVERAVQGARDVSFLRQFRGESRERFVRTALGNGALFAREFEESATAMLNAKRSGTLNHVCLVDTLPAQDILHRAYTVLRYNQMAAAERIIDYCLRAYPDCGTAHILWTMRLVPEGRFEEAAQYLLERLPRFAHGEQVAALLNVARCYLLADRIHDAREAIQRAESVATEDPYDNLQLRMLSACLRARDPGSLIPVEARRLPLPVHVEALIVCDDEAFFQSMQSRIKARCYFPDGLQVSFVRCAESRKSQTYQEAFGRSNVDILLWLHKNIDIYSPSFFIDLVVALEHCDMLGIAGARQWEHLDWRLSHADNKEGSFLVPSDEKPGSYEVLAMGMGVQTIAQGMCVLDGSLIATRLNRLNAGTPIELDRLLEGGAALMEEYFSHEAYKAGMRLAVHKSLGVVMDWRMQLLNDYLGEARWTISQRLGFEPFADLKEDRTMISGPVATAEEGVVAQYYFLEEVT